MYAVSRHTERILTQQLVQDGVVSAPMMQEALQISGTTSPEETLLAHSLMSSGVSREALRSWMTQQVTNVLRTLFTWKHGIVDFTEDAASPSERLLVSLPISSLLETLADDNDVSQSREEEQRARDAEKEQYAYLETQLIPAHQTKSQSAVKQAMRPSRPSPPVTLPERPQAFPEPAPLAQEFQPAQAIQAPATLVKSDVSRAKTLFESSQFFAKPTESPLPLPASALLSPVSVPVSVPDTTVSSGSVFDINALFSSINATINTDSDLPLQSVSAAITPAPSVSYIPPRSIDVSFMRLEMVVVPSDMSQSREQHVQITPDEWLLLTQVDGQTSLRDLCNIFRLPDAQIFAIAGTLMEQHVIHVVPPQTLQAQQASLQSPSMPSIPAELSPASRELVAAGLHNGLATPGYHASVAQPWGDVLPNSNIEQFSSAFQTQSQWGNGGRRSY